MPLAPGTRLGPYEVISPLGAGGMGEVYRARDTRLGREVAIKVLPQHLILNSEVRARFEREARTISGLNHPNICTLFDVGREGDADYLVMELIEGETLASRLLRGALPFEQTFRFGIEIAAALERAHRAGVVHRDLKPGNIMITGGAAKLMDFGLARAAGMAGPASATGVSIAALTQSPTVAHPLTSEGTLVGTFQYMSPEQLEGREADVRSDLWALGCVLYEMAAGRRAFEGRSQASLIGAIMGGPPAPISQVSPMAPPALDKLIRECLTREPGERVQSAHDVEMRLRWIAESGPASGTAPGGAHAGGGSRVRERIAWALVATLALATAALGIPRLRPAPSPPPVVFTFTPPATVSFVDLPRISPDGRLLAFNAGDSTGATFIWVRPMSSQDAVRLAGTEGATRPFWSPDSRWLAFFSNGKLRKIDIRGGPPQPVCDAPRGADGSWSREGVILFDGTTTDSVQRVLAAGGVAEAATVVDRAHHESFTAWPQFLPDGRHFLYIAYETGSTEGHLKLGELGSLRTRAVGDAPSRVEYASNHVLWLRAGTLLAQRFDPGAGKLVGEPFPLAEGIESGGNGAARFSASGEGTLVYRALGTASLRRLVWVDRAGHEKGQVGAPAVYSGPSLSPDGRQLAVRISDPAVGKADIWTWDLSRNVSTRATFDNDNVFDALWTPDGSGIVFTRPNGGNLDVFQRVLGSSGGDSLFVHGPGMISAESWSPDGKTLFYSTRSVGGWDIGRTDASSPRTPQPLVDSRFDEYGPRVSPDGRWLLYSSEESGREEIYVQAYPGPGGKWRVSTQGGTEANWRGDGREIVYLTPDRSLMSVTVEPGATPRFGLPQKLFDAPVMPETNVRNRMAPTRDFQRFLLVSSQGERKLGPTTVVLHWQQLGGRK